NHICCDSEFVWSAHGSDNYIGIFDDFLYMFCVFMTDGNSRIGKFFILHQHMCQWLADYQTAVHYCHVLTADRYSIPYKNLSHCLWCTWHETRSILNQQTSIQ